MKHLLTITLFAAMAVCCGSSKSTEQTSQGSVTTINVEEFAKIIGKKNVRLIDVRTPKEYAEGHLAGAENIDVKAADFAERIKDVKGKVAVYCRSGKRSLMAAEQLSAKGCTVYNLDGGIMAWQKAGKPVVK
ncbi:MAG: rhodanese-like domain-containing protein [Bacteroidales bacterium]|nr:rhodanese-like domain-containing protein [Bacteroidales bacterium]